MGEVIIILIESQIMQRCDGQLQVRFLDLTRLRHYKIMLSCFSIPITSGDNCGILIISKSQETSVYIVYFANDISVRK